MSRRERRAGFWIEGPAQHAQALSEAESDEISKLEARLGETEDPNELEELRSAIARVRSRYRERRREAKGLLFVL